MTISGGVSENSVQALRWYWPFEFCQIWVEHKNYIYILKSVKTVTFVLTVIPHIELFVASFNSKLLGNIFNVFCVLFQ